MNVNSTQRFQNTRRPDFTNQASTFKAADEQSLTQIDGYIKSQERGDGSLGDMAINATIGGVVGGVGGLLGGAVVANQMGMGPIGLIGAAVGGAVVCGASGLGLGLILT